MLLLLLLINIVRICFDGLLIISCVCILFLASSFHSFCYFFYICKEICSLVPIFYYNGPKCPSDSCLFMRIQVWFECLLLQFKAWLDSAIGAIKGTVKALLLAPWHSLVEDSLYEILFHSTRIWDKSYDMTKQRWVFCSLVFLFFFN